MLESNATREAIEAGETALGIEFGSTRVKAVLIGTDQQPLATGGHEWSSRLENGYWTYDLEDAWSGLQEAYAGLAHDVKERHGVVLDRIGVLGFSALMHGYLAFDEHQEHLVPIRTYQNTTTDERAGVLSEDGARLLEPLGPCPPEPQQQLHPRQFHAHASLRRTRRTQDRDGHLVPE